MFKWAIRPTLSAAAVLLAGVAACDSILPDVSRSVNVGVYIEQPDGDEAVPGLQPVSLGAKLSMNLVVRNDGAYTAFPPIVVADTVAVEFDASAGDEITLVVGPEHTSWEVDDRRGIIRFTLEEPLSPGQEISFRYEVVFGELGSQRKSRYARVVSVGGGQDNEVCAMGGHLVLEMLAAGVQCDRTTEGDELHVWVSGDAGQDNGEDLYALALLLADRGVRVIGVDAAGWARFLVGKESPQHCDPNPPASSWEMYDRFLRLFDYRPLVPLYSGAMCGTAEPAMPRDPADFSPGAYLPTQAALAIADELAERIRNDGPVLHYVATGTVTNLSAALIRLRDDPQYNFGEAEIGRKLVVHMEGFDFSASYIDVHLNMQTDPMAFKVLFEWDSALELFVLPTRPDQVAFEYKFLESVVNDASTPCSSALFNYMLSRWEGTSGDYPCGDPTYVRRTTSLQLGGGVLGYLVSKSRGGREAHPNYILDVTTVAVYRPGRLDVFDNFERPSGGRRITMYRVPDPEQRKRIREEAMERLLTMECSPHVVCWTTS